MEIPIHCFRHYDVNVVVFFQREFWRFVHNRETYVSVHRGTVDTNHEDSCFPTDKGNPYSK